MDYTRRCRRTLYCLCGYTYSHCQGLRWLNRAVDLEIEGRTIEANRALNMALRCAI